MEISTINLGPKVFVLGHDNLMTISCFVFHKTWILCTLNALSPVRYFCTKVFVTYSFYEGGEGRELKWLGGP